MNRFKLDVWNLLFGTIFRFTVKLCEIFLKVSPDVLVVFGLLDRFRLDLGPTTVNKFSKGLNRLFNSRFSTEIT